MNYQQERVEFMKWAVQQGLSRDTVIELLRNATTLQRLAAARRTGNWPADNGVRKVIFCECCGGGFVSSSFKKGLCPECYAAARVKELLTDTALVPEFNGDHGGAVLRLHLAGTSVEDMKSGRSRGLYVPYPRKKLTANVLPAIERAAD